MKVNKVKMMARVIVGMGLVLGTLIGNNAYTQGLDLDPSIGPVNPKIFLDGKEISEIPDEVFADVSFDKNERSGCISAVYLDSLDTFKKGLNFQSGVLDIKLKKREMKYLITDHPNAKHSPHQYPFQGMVKLEKHPKANCITKVERKIYYSNLAGTTQNNMNEKIPSIEVLKKDGRIFDYLTHLHENLGKEEGCSKYLDIPSIANRIHKLDPKFLAERNISINVSLDNQNDIIAPRSRLNLIKMISLEKTPSTSLHHLMSKYYFIDCDYLTKISPGGSPRYVYKVDKSKSTSSQLVVMSSMVSVDNNQNQTDGGLAFQYVLDLLKTTYSSEKTASYEPAPTETLDETIEYLNNIESCTSNIAPAKLSFTTRWFWGQNAQYIPKIYPGIISQIQELESHLNGREILPEFEPFKSQYPDNFRMNGCPINFQQPTSGSCKNCKQPGTLEGSDRILPIRGKSDPSQEGEEKKAIETGI